MPHSPENESNVRNSIIFASIVAGGTLLMAAFYLFLWPVMAGKLSGFNKVESEDRLFFDFASGAVAHTQLTVDYPFVDDTVRGSLTVDPNGKYDDQFEKLVITIDESEVERSTVEIYDTPAEPIDLGKFSPSGEMTIHATLEGFTGSVDIDSSTVMIPVKLEFS